MREFFSFSKEVRLNELASSAQRCELCERLGERSKVLSNANGDLNSRLLFVAEAPGRLGADKTGIPLCGDKTGRNFERLIGNVGWKRTDIFITNAVLCNPRREDGSNATPTNDEIENCTFYLRMIIELVNPELVVALGNIALKALSSIARIRTTLKNDVGRNFPWYGRILVPLYHPGPRAQVHRSFSKQTADFLKLAKLVKPSEGVVKSKKFFNPRKKVPLELDQLTPLHKVLFSIVSFLKRVPYFKLTKLIYLTDYIALKKIGSTITGDIYLRQPDGPWLPKLKEAIRVLECFEVTRGVYRRVPFVELGPSPRFEIDLGPVALNIVSEVLEKYGTYDNKSIKTAVYLTEPMRYVLSQEKKGRDMRRVPIIYQDRTAPELDPTRP